MKQEEIEDFAVRLGGGMLGAVEDGALEAYYKSTPASHGQFPFSKAHPLIPPYDDLIIGAAAIPPWVIGALMESDAKKRGDIRGRETGEKIREIGEGDAIYSFNMVLQKLFDNVLSPSPIHARVSLGRKPTPPGNLGGADVGHKIVSL